MDHSMTHEERILLAMGHAYDAANFRYGLPLLSDNGPLKDALWHLAESLDRFSIFTEDPGAVLGPLREVKQRTSTFSMHVTHPIARAIHHAEMLTTDTRSIEDLANDTYAVTVTAAEFMYDDAEHMIARIERRDGRDPIGSALIGRFLYDAKWYEDHHPEEAREIHEHLAVCGALEDLSKSAEDINTPYASSAENADNMRFYESAKENAHNIRFHAKRIRDSRIPVIDDLRLALDLGDTLANALADLES